MAATEQPPEIVITPQSFNTLEPVVPKLTKAAEPIVLPVPGAGVKVLPRWAVEDEVCRWRLKYRAQDVELDVEQSGTDSSASQWVELELRPFTRELPLAGLDHGLPHLFTVALETADGWSDWSRVVTCTPPAPGVPGQPAAVLPTVIGKKKVLLRWTRPVDVAVSGSVACGCVLRYRVLVTWTGYTPGEPVETAKRLSGEFDIVVEGDMDECEVDDLDCCQEYYFHVAAENVSGWGPWSDRSEMVTMPPPVPEAPPMPMMRRPTHRTAIIQWQHPPSEAPLEGFTFRYTRAKDFESGAIEELPGIAPNMSQYLIQGLVPGATYIFQVRGVSKFGPGFWSETSIPMETPEGSEPAKVVDLAVAHIYRSFITLQWSPPNDNGFDLTKQVLRFSFTPKMEDAMEIEPPVRREKDMDMCDLRHLQKKVYYFQVGAENKMGKGHWSSPLEVNLQKLGTEALCN
mmetsp:Transcript_10808/g.24713  ORF Transcript_10808/g.24713 Transcript_10808/m.24713 type:complete len:458 (+) Transcript_10808:80-1453(+)